MITITTITIIITFKLMGEQCQSFCRSLPYYYYC